MGGMVSTVVVVVVIKVTVTTPLLVTVLVSPYWNEVVYGLGEMVAEFDKELVGNTSRQEESEHVTVVEVQICVSTNIVLMLS